MNGCYQVSNYGRVKSLKRSVKRYDGYTQSYSERILKCSMNKKGYQLVMLCKEGIIYPKTVHRLVAETFIPNPENKPNVDHLDTNTHNNKVDNLKWVTQKENCLNPITRKKNSMSKIGHKGYLRQHTEKSKKLMSEKAKGRKFSYEHRKHLSEALKKYYKERRDVL